MNNPRSGKQYVQNITAFESLLCNELLNFLIDLSASYILRKPIIVLSVLF